MTNRTAQTLVAPLPLHVRVRAHLAIIRLDHSIKNIFVVPGILIPLSILKVPFTRGLAKNIVIGFIAVTLIACSNYVVNEVLDAPFDRLHPKKKSRPVAQGLVNVTIAYVQWIVMMIAGLALSWTISRPFTFAAAALWIMGCLYNIKPFRTKDVVYLDVLTESINNPLRMVLGWYMVTSELVPPLSLIVCYWMMGCYFMALKRFSEYREIKDPFQAGAYRRSFQRYTERSLLGSALFYASTCMLFLGAFIMRYRIELILAFPFIALMMSTYFNMAFNQDSAAQNPEKLYREPVLMIETVLTVLVIVALLCFNVPLIGRLFSPTVPMNATW
jgi:decaprenyl-phosphate phosphoribosyltransferase